VTVEQPDPETPRAEQRKHSRISPLWVLPVIAAGLAGCLIYQTIANHGPSITITFKTADGLSVQQTQVKHKAVTLGTVQAIELSDGEDHVVVHLKMDARAEPMLTDKAQFWVVRPRLQGGGVSALATGLETLVSGSYIELDPGAERGAEKRAFEGLEQPPAVRSGEPGDHVLAARGRDWLHRRWLGGDAPQRPGG
jgi:paraquat-inducible protein B